VLREAAQGKIFGGNLECPFSGLKKRRRQGEGRISRDVACRKEGVLCEGPEKRLEEKRENRQHYGSNKEKRMSLRSAGRGGERASDRTFEGVGL